MDVEVDPDTAIRFYEDPNEPRYIIKCPELRADYPQAMGDPILFSPEQCLMLTEATSDEEMEERPPKLPEGSYPHEDTEQSLAQKAANIVH